MVTNLIINIVNHVMIFLLMLTDTFNRIMKKLAYFEFNTDEKTDSEIAECLWNKIKLVSDKNWETLAV